MERPKDVNCQYCKGTGVLTLLYSTVPCECSLRSESTDGGGNTSEWDDSVPYPFITRRDGVLVPNVPESYPDGLRTGTVVSLYARVGPCETVRHLVVPPYARADVDWWATGFGCMGRQLLTSLEVTFLTCSFQRFRCDAGMLQLLPVAIDPIRFHRANPLDVKIENSSPDARDVWLYFWAR